MIGVVGVIHQIIKNFISRHKRKTFLREYNEKRISELEKKIKKLESEAKE